MKVFVKFKSCTKEIIYRTNSYTRVEFAMLEGDLKQLGCSYCNGTYDFEVDEFYAKHSKIAQIIAGLVFLIGTPSAFLILSTILTIAKVTMSFMWLEDYC